MFRCIYGMMFRGNLSIFFYFIEITYITDGPRPDRRNGIRGCVINIQFFTEDLHE